MSESNNNPYNERPENIYERAFEREEDGEGGSSVEYGPSGYYANAPQTKKRKKGWFVALVLGICLLFSFIAGGIGVAIGKNMGKDDSTPSVPFGDPTTAPNNTVIMQETDVSAATVENATAAAVVQKCAPSVVEIIITPYTNNNYEAKSGAGSGVIIGESEDGASTYIVTNNHVIEGNYSVITVRTNKGKEYSAEIVGTDWVSDIAILRIAESGLTKAVWANSDSLLQGQDIIVIGNPLGSLGGSVTRGIISNVERTLSIEGVPMKLLQIDAAVNPGNSGGGLFDMNGNLVGIVNAKSVGTEVEGIGFAIPSNYAKEMTTEIAAKGYVAGRVDLGLTFTVASGSVGSSGEVLIINSSKNSTDIQSGDILYSVQLPDGSTVKIDSLGAYRGVLSKLKAGDTVKVTVDRAYSYGIWTRHEYVDITLTAHEIQN